MSLERDLVDDCRDVAKHMGAFLEDSRKGYPVTFDNLSEEYERYREDMVTALAAKDEEIAALRSHQAQVKRAEQAEAEVALRDRMLRDIIERIALTPERWNGWTTEEVLADLRARAEKEIDHALD